MKRLMKDATYFSLCKWPYYYLWLYTAGAQERLSLVLSRLTEAALKINPTKCKLLQEKVVVLGHVVSWEGINLRIQRKQESKY